MTTGSSEPFNQQKEAKVATTFEDYEYQRKYGRPVDQVITDISGRRTIFFSDGTKITEPLNND